MDETTIDQIEAELAHERAYRHTALIEAVPQQTGDGWVDWRLTVARHPAKWGLPTPMQQAHTSVVVEPHWLLASQEPDEDEPFNEGLIAELARRARVALWEEYGYAVCGEVSASTLRLTVRVVPVEDRRPAR